MRELSLVAGGPAGIQRGHRGPAWGPHGDARGESIVTRGRSGRVRRARAALLLSVAVLAVGILPATPADASTHGVAQVNATLRDGFVRGSVWFRDTGPGGSAIHAWVDAYDAVTAEHRGSMGHRWGRTSCRTGGTCWELLTTSIQAKAGECYVVRGSSGRGADVAEGRAPSYSRLCA